MLSPILNNHIDLMDVLEAQMQDDIDKAIAAIDIQALMANPQATMLETVKMIEKVLVQKYGPQAMKHAVDLIKTIEKRNVIVDPTKDATLNDNGDGKKQS